MHVSSETDSSKTNVESPNSLPVLIKDTQVPRQVL